MSRRQILLKSVENTCRTPGNEYEFELSSRHIRALVRNSVPISSSYFDKYRRITIKYHQKCRTIPFLIPFPEIKHPYKTNRNINRTYNNFVVVFRVSFPVQRLLFCINCVFLICNILVIVACFIVTIIFNRNVYFSHCVRAKVLSLFNFRITCHLTSINIINY